MILFAVDMHQDHRLILCANRDEFYDRPTAPLGWWEDHPMVLAGRDLKGGGTWMGITRSGRVAGITNFRDPARLNPGAPTRGELVSDFLCKDESARSYLERIHSTSGKYNGFNLVLGDTTGFYYYSNYQNKITTLSPGVYGLSNGLIDCDWPKVQKGKDRLSALINTGVLDDASLFSLLKDREKPLDHQLPDTGVGTAWERILSPLFIESSGYGTRSSSVIRMDFQGQVYVAERTFDNREPHWQARASDTRVYQF
nr:NRDE family protein [Desulfocicer vacuolatum]